jgi:hypothetical protein
MGDRHLKFHETRDNLSVARDSGIRFVEGVASIMISLLEPIRSTQADRAAGGSATV